MQYVPDAWFIAIRMADQVISPTNDDFTGISVYIILRTAEQLVSLTNVDFTGVSVEISQKCLTFRPDLASHHKPIFGDGKRSPITSSERNDLCLHGDGTDRQRASSEREIYLSLGVTSPVIFLPKISSRIMSNAIFTL